MNFYLKFSFFISAKMLKSIAGKVINYNQLWDLGLALKVSEHDIEKAKTNNQKDIEGASFTVLRHWLDMGKADIGVLVSALHDSGLTPCVQEYLMEEETDDEDDEEDEQFNQGATSEADTYQYLIEEGSGVDTPSQPDQNDGSVEEGIELAQSAEHSLADGKGTPV